MKCHHSSWFFSLPCLFGRRRKKNLIFSPLVCGNVAAEAVGNFSLSLEKNTRNCVRNIFCPLLLLQPRVGAKKETLEKGIKTGPFRILLEKRICNFFEKMLNEIMPDFFCKCQDKELWTFLPTASIALHIRRYVSSPQVQLSWWAFSAAKPSIEVGMHRIC